MQGQVEARLLGLPTGGFKYALRRARPWELSRKWGGSETSTSPSPARGSCGERNAALVFAAAFEISSDSPSPSARLPRLFLAGRKPHPKLHCRYRLSVKGPHTHGARQIAYRAATAACLGALLLLL